MMLIMKFRIALACLFLGTAFSAQGATFLENVSLFDDFYVIRYTDGSAKLKKNLSHTEIDDYRDRHDVR